MSFQAIVYRVLIASPSDVSDEREAIKEAMNLWNTQNSEMFNIIFMPTMWETNTVPEMGDRPQAKINEQIVDKSDLLIGVFWTRLGTSTGVANSGTLEEIQRFIDSNKKVMIFFSNKAMPPKEFEPTQFMKLQEFKQECYTRGLLGDFTTIDELSRKISELLMKLAREADTSIVPPQIRNNTREPKFKIKLNGSSDHISLIKPEVTYNKERHEIIEYNEIDEHLLKYITEEDVQKYNDSIPDQEKVRIYNEELEVYTRVQEGRIDLKIEVSNIGNLKANNVYCTLRFPPQILVIEKDSYDDWKKPQKPDEFPVNPLLRARQKYNDDLRKKIYPTYGIKANTINTLSIFNNVTSDVFNSAKYTRYLIRNTNWRVGVTNNVVSININSLMHTKKFVFDEELEVIPLKLGESNVELEIISEELEIPIKYTIPVNVLNTK